MVQQQQSTASLTSSELDAPPVTGVGDLVIRALGTGVSAAMLTCAGAWMLQQPADVIGKASGVAFLVVTGGAGTWLMLSADAWRKARARHRLTERKLHAAYAAIQRLEYTIADQRETIKTLQSNRTTPVQTVQPSNRVLSHNIAPDVVECANRIINHWFDAGIWYSRRIAKDAGWSQPTHDAAIKLLKDMGMVEQEPGKTPRILPRFGNLGTALEFFNNFCQRVADGPQIPGRTVVMSNDGDDD